MKHRALRSACRRATVLVCGFSLISNVLMLFSALYVMQLFDRVITTGSLATLEMLTVLVLAAIAAQNLIEHARQRILTQLGTWFEQHLLGPALIAAVHARLLGKPYHHHALADLRSIRSFLTGGHLVAVADALWIPLVLAVVSLLSPTLGLIALIAVAILVVLHLIGSRLQAHSNRSQARNALAEHDRREQLVQRGETIIANGMLPQLITAFQGQRQELVQTNDRLARLHGLLTGLTRWLRATAVIAIQATSAFLIINGQLSAGGFIAINILFSRALIPVETLCRVYGPVQQARAAWSRLSRHLDEQAQRIAVSTKSLATPALAGPLQVDNLTWRPQPKQRPLLMQLRLYIPTSQVIALVGPVGVGKSSLLRLMAGLIEPTSGCVRWNGYALSEIDSDYRGRHCGYLEQDPQLLEGTIADNICRFETDPDPDAIVAAASLAGCHELIQRFSAGYNTPVGPGGQQISGGQLQLIALARAIYRLPPYIFLDEPNANLDQQGDHALIRCLLRLREQGHVVIVVSHRPSVLEAATAVVVIRNGGLQEQSVEEFNRANRERSRNFRRRDTTVQRVQQRSGSRRQQHATADRAEESSP